MKGKRILIILVAVVLFAALSYVVYNFNQKPLSFLSISINPDIELAVNEDNIVKEVIPINEDADIITSDLELVGKTVEEASDSIVDAAIETGYIDEYSEENTVIVTTTNEDETIRKALEDKVMARLNKHFEERKIYPVLVANGLDDELKAEAASLDIINGKMLLVDRAVAVNPDLNKTELAKMSVKEIQQKIKDYVTARHDALKQSREELKTKWQQEKATLKTEYNNKVDALKDNLLKNAGINTDNMTPAQKNAAVKELLQNKKDQIKNKINEVKDELKNEVQQDVIPTVKNRIENIRERIKQGLKKGA
jgi:hypothetical protein